MAPKFSLLNMMFVTIIVGLVASIVGCMQPVQRVKDTSIVPIVINTWNFNKATEKAWDVLSSGGQSLDAIEQGCTKCEQLQCDGTVGYGGSPDEYGETTLDAMIMDGTTHKVGAVGALRDVQDAISVARKIMEHTDHTMLVGSQATEFALSMGFTKKNLTTVHSKTLHDTWIENSCQPNFWSNVSPDPKQFCGPYSLNAQPSVLHSRTRSALPEGVISHDTIGMIAIDSAGQIAGGTSTNGAIHKIPGRVGDSPIAGSGAYVDQEVGGAAATGDGDIMMRFMPSLIAVENMRRGLLPDEASKDALLRIIKHYPNFSGAVVAMTISGHFGAACYGLPSKNFHYCVGSRQFGGVKVFSVQCIS